MVLTRICQSCRKEKELNQDNFYPRKYKDNLYFRWSCKLCELNKSNNFNSKYRNKKIILRRTQRLENPNKYLYELAKWRAKSNKIVFEIEEKDITIPEFCPVLGIKLNNHIGEKKRQDDSPSIDRIDNTKGYIKGNVQVISHRANQIKNCGTLEEHEKIVKYIRNYLTDNLE